MNLPQYTHTLETAVRDYEQACADARERMLKAIAVAREEFFEGDERKAVSLDEVIERRR